MTTGPRRLAPLGLLLALALAAAGAHGVMQAASGMAGSVSAAVSPLVPGAAISGVPTPLSPAGLVEAGVRLPGLVRQADAGAGPLGGARARSAVRRLPHPYADAVRSRARGLRRTTLSYLFFDASARSGHLAAPSTAPPSLS